MEAKWKLSRCSQAFLPVVGKAGCRDLGDPYRPPARSERDSVCPQLPPEPPSPPFQVGPALRLFHTWAITNAD